MNVEIVEFYPTERNDKKEFLRGTLHVYLIDYELDIRGIFVIKKKNYWYISLPYFTAIDQETEKKIRYPLMTFMDIEKQKALEKAIKEKGIEYISNNFLNKTEELTELKV